MYPYKLKCGIVFGSGNFCYKHYYESSLISILLKISESSQLNVFIILIFFGF